jgi:tRNA threonylcarbamoyladenosine biosynthesis protein TsaB
VRLLLDSSGAELLCALADAEGVILEQRYATGTPESRDIGAAVGFVMGELGPRDLDAIVVGTGPGSFIGTRVAISYANGLAAAGGMAVHGVNSLAAIGAVYAAGRCAVLREARRGGAYL